MRKVCCLLALSCVSILPQTASLAESQQEVHPVKFTDSNKSASVSTRQILVRVQLAEVFLSKMRKLGVDFSVFPEDRVIEQSGPEAFRYGDNLLYSTGHFDVFLNALLQNKIARILADPSIVAIDGKTASLSVGGSVNIANQEGNKESDRPSFVHVGTELKILPTLLPNNRVSIDLVLSWSELCDDKKPDGSKRHYEIDTSLETELGSSFLLSSNSLVERVDAANENETALLLLVTPTRIEETASATQHQTK